MMANPWFCLIVTFGFLFAAIDASAGDADPLYRTCVKQCEKTGSIGDISVQHCQFSDEFANSSWYMQEPLYMQWKQLNCRSDCRYHCMMQRESEREKLGLKPVKYHGKWPFKRVHVFQEPVSAALSALNLLMHFNGWLSFFMLVNYKLPLRSQSKRTYYEFTGLWHIYGLLSMNAWFWSAIFHTRDFELTEKLDYSSAVALLGYSLILALLRTFNVKDEASRVMYAAPILAFVTTHILYLNFYELDYGELTLLVPVFNCYLKPGSVLDSMQSGLCILWKIPFYIMSPVKWLNYHLFNINNCFKVIIWLYLLSTAFSLIHNCQYHHVWLQPFLRGCQAGNVS